MARIATGSTLIHSGTKALELVEESEGNTEFAHKWVWGADVDTDFECGEPAVADPDPAVAGLDPAVAGLGGEDPAVADPPQQKRVILTPRPKVVRKSASASTGKLYARRGRMQTFNLSSEGTTYGTTSDVRRMSDGYIKDNIPCRVSTRDVRMATYTLGAHASPFDLAHQLRRTDLAIIVLVFTGEISEQHDIYKQVKRWARTAQEFDGTQPPAQSEAAGTLEFTGDKRFIELGTRDDMFAVIDKGMVRCAMFEERALSISESSLERNCSNGGHSCRAPDGCLPDASDQDVHFGTLTVHFQDAIDDSFFLRIGIAVVRHPLTKAQVEGLAQWIILHRLPVLTGYFADSHDYRAVPRKINGCYYGHSNLIDYADESINYGSPLTDLGIRSGAIGNGPFYQRIDMSSDEHQQRTVVAPSLYMFFGFYKRLRTPSTVPRYIMDAPAELILGEDIEKELISNIQLPYWGLNYMGNAMVPHLGTIRMSQLDWSEWINGCVITQVRFGGAKNLIRCGSDRDKKAERREIRQVKKRRKGDPRADEEYDDELESVSVT